LSDGSTLWAAAARIDLLGQPLVSQLTLDAQAERVALLGDWSALFLLLSGEATLSAGDLRLAGAGLPQAVEQGQVGLVRLDPLLPATWSVEQLLASSAELCGAPLKAAQKAAFQTLERLGLLALAARRLAHLDRAERRAALIAHAAVTDPRVLCLELPLAGLDSPGEAAVLAVIERATSGRRLLVAFGDVELGPGARQLLQTCGEHWRLSAGVACAASASVPAATRVTATVCRNHRAFAQALSARGLSAYPTHEAGLLGTLTSAGAGPCWRYLVELPGGSTAPVLDAALETEAGLVELLPVGEAAQS
jgi:ABC-type molybdenum transport system ATPase subunit/photorepair protein PhrA